MLTPEQLAEARITTLVIDTDGVDWEHSLVQRPEGV